MATVNLDTRTVTIRLVFVGPTGAGSGTNVRRLHEQFGGTRRNRLHRFGPTGTDARSWFFDMSPQGATLLHDLALHVQLVSLPLDIDVGAHRQEVLRDADAIIFVADARRDSDVANVDAMLAVEQALSEVGRKLAAMPVVIQVNHIDDDTARPPDDVVFAINPYGFPVVPCAALEGRGVVESYETVLQLATDRVRAALTGQGVDARILAVARPDDPVDGDQVAAWIRAITRSSNTANRPVVQDEVVADEDIPSAGDVEVGLLPPEMVGFVPVGASTLEVEGDHVHLDVILRNRKGDVRRVHLVLAPRPALSATQLAPSSFERVPSPVTAHLPDRFEDVGQVAATDWNLAAAGLVGGAAIGALSIYLLMG